jgi:hypothetical protein
MTGDGDIGREIRGEHEIRTNVDHVSRRGRVHDRSSADNQFWKRIPGSFDEVSQHIDGAVTAVRELECRQTSGHQRRRHLNCDRDIGVVEHRDDAFTSDGFENLGLGVTWHLWNPPSS